MGNYYVSVRKITDESLMREACEMTFLGTSKQSLLSIYKSEHSPARTQIFWVTAKSIPLFVATHLLRHHVGSIPFQLTCRSDRHGANPGLITKLDDINLKLMGINTLINCGDTSSAQDCIQSVVSELEWLQKNSDRYTPVNLGLLLNAQSLIDMSKLRLCLQASKETTEVFQEIKSKVADIDPDLAKMMVRKCVYRNGLCGEPACCGFNNTAKFIEEANEYKSNFSKKQQGYEIQSH